MLYNKKVALQKLISYTYKECYNNLKNYAF